jgi:hypothetical protein
MSHRTSTSRVRSQSFSATVHDVKSSSDYVLSMNSSVRSQRKYNLQPLRPYHVYKFLPQQYHANVPTYTAQSLESHNPSAGIFNLSLTVLLLLVIVLFLRPFKAQTYIIYYLEKENYLSRQKPPLTVVALLLQHVLYRGASTVLLQH